MMLDWNVRYDLDSITHCDYCDSSPLTKPFPNLTDYSTIECYRCGYKIHTSRNGIPYDITIKFDDAWLSIQQDVYWGTAVDGVMHWGSLVNEPMDILNLIDRVQKILILQ